MNEGINIQEIGRTPQGVCELKFQCRGKSRGTFSSRTPQGVCELKYRNVFPRHRGRGRTPQGVCELKSGRGASNIGDYWSHPAGGV